MERCLKANSEKETTAIAIWANNQLSLVSLWQRTGVKPDKLEFWAQEAQKKVKKSLDKRLKVWYIISY